MTLKEELETLRGEPIQVFTGGPMDIPCIETSDPEKLCKHPVVSVHMITYNHEPYIRQAIEGVMMQKTDFEFELVIGEDCSTDKTREICFEYQKKYPDKIRVLWWHENLYRNPQLGGTNGRRNLAHCRGEFIAFCEGDDYWIDPLKLQKQVDVMWKYPNVGLCFGGADAYYQVTGEVRKFKPYFRGGGVMRGDDYNRTRFGIARDKSLRPFVDDQLRTLTALVRRSVMINVHRRYSVFRWRLCVGDYSLWSGIATEADVYFLDENVGVYRVHSGGITSLNLNAVVRDCEVIREFFLVEYYKFDKRTAYERLVSRYLQTAMAAKPFGQIRMSLRFVRCSILRNFVKAKYDRVRMLMMLLGLYRAPFSRWLEYMRGCSVSIFKLISSFSEC